MNLRLIFLLFCIWSFCLQVVADSQLTDDQLSQIQFDQKIGAQVPLALVFTNETGVAVRLGDCFGNKPAVLILGYYSCPMLCTLVLNGAAECFRNLTWKAGQQFNVVFVSINPDESPSLAAEKKMSYVKAYGRDYAGSWNFLTGNENSITNLANAIGFRFSYDAVVKQFAHPSGLVILTDRGNVARYLFGVNFAARDVDDALRGAAANKMAAPESQFTLLCFHYAPIHGRYGNLIMKVVRGSGILTVVILGGLLLTRRPRKMERSK